MNVLTVDYDDEGVRHYYRDGEEISEKAYMTQHPGMPTPKGNTDGRDGSTDSGSVGTGESGVSAIQSAIEVQGDEQRAEEISEGIRRQRAKVRASQRAGNPGDGVGQRGQRPEPA